MTEYTTPVLTLVGSAQNIVLGASQENLKAIGCESDDDAIYWDEAAW